MNSRTAFPALLVLAFGMFFAATDARGANATGQADAKTLDPIAASGDAGRAHGTAASHGATAARPIALLVDWSAKHGLLERRPDVATALALLEWNGQRNGLIRDEEMVLSFLGAPTPATVASIRRHGRASAFDETFSALPDQHWLRVSVMLREHPSGSGLDAVVLTTRQAGERTLEAWAPVVLTGPAVLATVDDTDGRMERFLAVQLDRAP